MNSFIFSVNTVAPVFLIILLGIFLKRKKVINENFISISSLLVFRISLPALIFIKIAETDFYNVFNIKEVLIAVAITVVFFIVAILLAVFLIKESSRRGAFVQGAFRANVAIIGFAIIFNVFGESGLARGAILLAFLLPIYNILAVISLTIFMHKEYDSPLKRILTNIIRNPLIIAVFLALPFSIFNIKIPETAVKTISYLAQMTLPLALIGVGGSLSFTSIKENVFLAGVASIIKIIVIPAATIYVASLFGFKGESLGILFIISGSPTAIASFIMARAMNNDSHLAANIILITTIGSIFTIGGGIFLLKSMGMI